MKYTDEQIFKQIKEGNKQDVLTVLYEEYYPILERYVCSRNGLSDDAKDIFQESIIIFYQKVITNKITYPQYKVSSFILGVAQKLWINKVRKNKVIERHQDYVKLHNEEGEVTHFDNLLTDNRKKVTEQVISSLGKKCHAILKLVLYNNLTLKEIAQELGYSSEDSVKTSHYRCRQKLIEKYKDNLTLKELLQSGE